jgi:ankyrin repeat protein
MLLDAKADVNALSNSKTALMVASQDGHHDVVNTLIEAGADLNIVTKDGRLALHYACMHPKSHPIAATLLAAGTLVDVPVSGVSPLVDVMRVRSDSSLDLMRTLIAAGTDVNRVSADGETTPFLASIAYDNVPAMKLLIDAKVDVNCQGGMLPPFFLAVGCGSVEMVKLLTTAGADPTLSVPNVGTCLHALSLDTCFSDIFHDEDVDNLAISKHKRNVSDVVNVLVDANADVSARFEEGVTPLILAAARGSVEVMSALLAVGANIDDTIDNGSTALAVAAGEGHNQAVSALIAAGANVNAVCKDGTPLILIAILENHINIVRALIAAGADVNSTHCGVSVLDIATSRGFSDIAATLRNAGAVKTLDITTYENEFLFAVMDGKIKIDSDFIATASKKDKDIALAVSTTLKRLPIIRNLLAASASPNVQFIGQSVVCIASMQGYTEIVRELIEAKADFSRKDKHGMKPIQYAAQRKHRDIVALLLAKSKERIPVN